MEQLVAVDQIDLNDESFKISRNRPHPDLYSSIKKYGMLEKPYVIKKENSYVLMTCHNRVRICSELNIEKIKVIILPAPDGEIFFNNLVLKLFRNGIGPLGRIKILHIIKQYFSDNEIISAADLRKITGLPKEYLHGENAGKAVHSFPAGLLDYIDTKDINFKTIKDLASIDKNGLEWLNTWVGYMQIGVNFFKRITEHLFDIFRMDKINQLPLPGDETIKSDADLYAEVFRIRYPKYSNINKQSLELIDKLSSKILSVDFPDFLERDYILLNFKISKNSTAHEWRKAAENLKDEYIKELLDLL